MGIIICEKTISSIQNDSLLPIFCGVQPAISAISVNKIMAERLLKIVPNKRSIKLESCFFDVIESLPTQPLIKDIDVLFNPQYKVDVLKMLVSVYRHKQYQLLWPGEYIANHLVYSMEGYPDYRVYNINDYDIMCVI